MQEISGAKPVRDADSIAPKAFSAMRSLGKRISSVQFRVRAVRLGGASPLSPTNFKESKPQQTGTGLLIRYGEVATTSGSTNSIHCGME